MNHHPQKEVALARLIALLCALVLSLFYMVFGQMVYTKRFTNAPEIFTYYPAKGLNYTPVDTTLNSGDYEMSVNILMDDMPSTDTSIYALYAITPKCFNADTLHLMMTFSNGETAFFRRTRFALQEHYTEFEITAENLDRLRMMFVDKITLLYPYGKIALDVPKKKAFFMTFLKESNELMAARAEEREW